MSDVDETSVPLTWIEVAVAEHRRLLDRLDGLVACGELDVSAPSLLPDWTLGHVITHVTQSADGHVRLLDAAARGEVGVQYPGGVEGRRAGIEAGAPRPASEQVDDLRRSCSELEHRWSTMPSWAGRGGTVRFEIAIADLPFLRVREVAIHHVDLGLGHGFDDLPAAYLDEELQRMEVLWIRRQGAPATALPSPVLAASPSIRLAWLLGRAGVAGVAPAGIY